MHILLIIVKHSPHNESQKPIVPISPSELYEALDLVTNYRYFPSHMNTNGYANLLKMHLMLEQGNSRPFDLDTGIIVRTFFQWRQTNNKHDTHVLCTWRHHGNRASNAELQFSYLGNYPTIAKQLFAIH